MPLVPAFNIGVWNAWIFMSVFIFQMLAVILLGKRVWEKSNQSTYVKNSKLEEKASIIGNAIWFLATVYSIFLSFQLGTTWFNVGLSIFLVGLIILAIATVDLATAPMDKPATEGLYRFSRHPLYLSLIIVYIGTSIAIASWVFSLLGIANIFWVRLEALVEERDCLEIYSQDYQEYMNITPRWIGIPKS